MEPIRTTKTARLRSLRMYREELDAFLALFKQNCQSVSLSDSKNRYDSLDEMKEHVGPLIRDLDVRGERPGVHFILNQKASVPGSSTPSIVNELRTEEITDEADALFLKMKEFLSGHQLPVVRVPFLMIAIVALVCVIAFGISDYKAGSQHLAWNTLLSALALAASMIPALKISNKLSLDTRRNSPSFWERNKEDFAKYLVTAIIGGIIGAIIAHLWK